jgi:S-formylglutathione hydrolase FrmB
MDSRLGRVETYLSVDVPAWIRTHLQVNTDPRAWAIAGFSQGGTCALQLAVRTPWVYPTFLDISGQDEPTLGTRTRTVDAAFRGDAPAFARVNPLVLLATNRYAASAGTIVVGREDRVYRAQQQHVFAACRAAGMDVRFLELPGGHTWHVWAPGLERSLPWLGARLGLTAP